MWISKLLISSSYIPIARAFKNQNVNLNIGNSIRQNGEYDRFLCGCRPTRFSNTFTRLYQSISQSPNDADADAVDEKHYVFGYGSLMCPLSRQITNENLMDKFTIPVSIQQLERQWCARTTTGYTAMGVQFTTTVGRFCTGILIGAIDAVELQDLDQREASYNRLPVPLDTISTVPFVDPNVYSNIDTLSEDDNGHYSIKSILDHNQNRRKQDQGCENTADVATNLPNEVLKVWVYVPKNPIPPDTSHPILQSYVDIILRGCFNTIGERFARSFISTTTGWSQSSSHRTNATTGHHYWVNDRDFPLYKRADRIYSVLNAARLDHVLYEELHTVHSNCGTTIDDIDCRSSITLPSIRRNAYDPILHLEQLTQNLELDVNSVHPMAFQHLVSRYYQV